MTRTAQVLNTQKLRSKRGCQSVLTNAEKADQTFTTASTVTTVSTVTTDVSQNDSSQEEIKRATKHTIIQRLPSEESDVIIRDRPPQCGNQRAELAGRCNPALSSEAGDLNIAVNVPVIPVWQLTHQETRRNFTASYRNAVVIPKVIRISPPRQRPSTERQAFHSREKVKKQTSKRVKAQPINNQTGAPAVRSRRVHHQIISRAEETEQVAALVNKAPQANNLSPVRDSPIKKAFKQHHDPQCRFPATKMAPLPPSRGAPDHGNLVAANGGGGGAPSLHTANAVYGAGGVGGNSSSQQQAPQPQQALRSHQVRMQQNFRQTNLQSPAISNAGSSTKPRSNNSRGGGSQNSSSQEHSSPKATPLFQRLVSDEVQELKSYARIIESQNRRLAELERVHADLEQRLEEQNNTRLDLERTLESREREFAERIAVVERDRDSWKAIVQAEQSKNSRLQEQVARKDQDIHAMLLRKYDNANHLSHRSAADSRAARTNDRGAATAIAASMRREGNGGKKESDSNGDLTRIQHKSPHEILASSGSAETLRERNISNALLDFFGV